jgi:hypothetical protein
LSSLLVVNYPTISKQDFEGIQNIRQRHDRLNFKAIDPHFTLVFPIADIDPEPLVSHIARLTYCTNAKILLLQQFRAVLCPPWSTLRLDIPFIPHIGIGNSLDPHSCKHLVDRLNADRLEIHGRVERLDLIWSDRDLGELPTVKRGNSRLSS